MTWWRLLFTLFFLLNLYTDGGGLDSSNRIELADFWWRDIDQTLLSVPVFATQVNDADQNVPVS